MNNASENFILNEEDMRNIKSILENNGNTLEKMVDDYYRLLTQIRYFAVLEGKTAGKLNELIKNTRILNDHIQTLSVRYGKICDSLVQEVDQRDRYLY